MKMSSICLSCFRIPFKVFTLRVYTENMRRPLRDETKMVPFQSRSFQYLLWGLASAHKMPALGCLGPLELDPNPKRQTPGINRFWPPVKPPKMTLLNSIREKRKYPKGLPTKVITVHQLPSALVSAAATVATAPLLRDSAEAAGSSSRLLSDLQYSGFRGSRG